MNSILVIFPSWEERSLFGFLRDIEKYPDVKKVYLLEFEQPIHAKEIASNIYSMQNECKTRKINLEFLSITIPKSDVESWRKIESFVRDLDNKASIYVDITTMPRNIIWTLLFFFRQKYLKATILYHKPEKYGDWLSKDPDTPQLLFKHSGVIEFGKPTTLFVLSGYDEDRAIQLVNYYEPQKVIVGVCNQRESSSYGTENPEIINIEIHNESWGYDVIESKIKIILETSNLMVASLGPKISSISVYQCFMKYPQIALAYVPCKEFNIDYSKGIKEMLVKEIVLND